MIRIRVEPEFDCDVIVVGAGPAGAAAACQLARSGMSVILIEQSVFPRDKICGDFVSQVALKELDQLGITDSDEFAETNVIREAAVFVDGIQRVVQPLPHIDGFQRYARVIPRMKLDSMIYAAAQRAGVRTMEGVRVLAFSVTPDKVEVRIQTGSIQRHLAARMLIGADGSNSRIAAQLRCGTTSNRQFIIAVRSYAKGIVGPEDRADLYFSTRTFPGYCWVFPTGSNQANVGVGAIVETLPKSRHNLRQLLVELVSTDAALRTRLGGTQGLGRIVGWPLKTFDARAPLVASRVALIGDAAGLINPLNGEGIQYGLKSARLISEVTLECSARNDFSPSALQEYVRRLESLRSDLLCARLVVDAIRHRGLNRVWLQAMLAMVSAAQSDELYARIAGGILSGLSPSTDALNAWFIGRTLQYGIAGMSMAGLESAFALVKSPNSALPRAIDVIGLGLEFALPTILHPAASVTWGLEVGGGAAIVGRGATIRALQTRLRMRGSRNLDQPYTG